MKQKEKTKITKLLIIPLSLAIIGYFSYLIAFTVYNYLK